MIDTIEAIANATIGLLISAIAVRYAFPLIGWETTTGQAVGVSLAFWGLSAVRSYILRKAFRFIDTTQKQN